MVIPELRFFLDAQPAVNALREHIDEQIRQAIVRIADGVAHTARETHPWQNRTGNLQASTHGSNVVDGDLWNNTLSSEVLGETEYGSFLEDDPQWAFLEPAWEANEAYAEDDLDRALGEAAHRAGW